LFDNPSHPYTRGLLACIPRLGEPRKRLVPISGQVPSPRDLPPGCSFLDRCPDAFAPCRGKMPPLTEIAPGHQVRCWRVQ
ncbi:MAG TPA: oligopeptide/dipeptide ABC transporter ATP-binding protein, partial [Desulfuromonadales bacterium]|nr:oligopeptide/dipeptide ABC transporter ATP-binding protein [Desulfuromonadales bacterium]